MSIGTVRPGLSGPSTPLSFATYSDLSAAVAANGGQSVGAVVNVAGAVYAWDSSANGGLGAYALIGGGDGSVSRPFATAAARDAAFPAPSGQIVWMVNPCVPLGKSRLQGFAAGVWFPPAGELIAGAVGAAGGAVASLASGLLTVQPVYASPVIPDYMIPDNIHLMAFAEMETKNAVSPVAGSKLQFILSNADNPTMGTSAIFYGYITPTAGGTKITPAATAPAQIQRIGADFKGSGPSGQTESFRAYTVGAFGAGATKARFMAQPSHASDIVTLWSYRIIASGINP